MIVVLDCSVVVPWLFEEEHEPFVDSLYREYRGDALIAAAPLLLRSEVANVAWKKVRRGEAGRDAALRLLRDFLMLPIDHAGSAQLFEPALRIALDTGVTVYDAHYLAMARVRGAALASQDARLLAVARDLNIAQYTGTQAPSGGGRRKGRRT
ncbi:MAG: PIN domain-containing protein [Chitinivibrionales bacterium]|nr:PIN domain-containing protein [Chitinivibrionales bacterium]